MDNASKALIIAGAVLIAVMLVSLGVLIYNQANQIVQENANTMSGLSVTGFNNLFSVYYGTNKPSATVKSLVEQVNSTNRTSEDRMVTIETSGTTGISSTTSGTITTYTFKPQKNTNYDIAGTKWDTNGYIKEVTVTAKTTS